MKYDPEKALDMSHSITRIYDSVDASVAEVCSATALALRARLDLEHDKLLRAFMLMNLIKHLTMDHKSASAFELIKPNGEN
jgi:hypothetical protein